LSGSTGATRDSVASIPLVLEIHCLGLVRCPAHGLRSRTGRAASPCKVAMGRKGRTSVLASNWL